MGSVVSKKQNVEKSSFRIITYAGEARSQALEALSAAMDGDLIKADELLMKSEETSKLAQKEQSKLLNEELNGNKAEVNMLFVHSQDHLMASLLAQDLIKSMIIMAKNKQDSKSEQD